MADIGYQALLGLEQGFQAGQHVVDGVAQVAQLVIRHRNGNTPAEILRHGDLMRSIRNGLDRAQRRASEHYTAAGCQ